MHAATYAEGGTIDITIDVSTPHWGRYRVSVCPLPADQVTQACFDNEAHWLTT